MAMAKDDYFSIVYKILQYLYDRLKAGENPDPDMLTHTSLGIKERYWLYVMIHMIKGGYIEGVEYREYATGPEIINLQNAEITPDGIEYLLDNRMIKKVIEVMRTVKDIVPYA